MPAVVVCDCSGFAAGIYTTNSAESCLHCALNGRADIIVVEDRKQLEKILLIKDKIPTLKAIVQYSGKPHVEGVITVLDLFYYHYFFPFHSFSSFHTFSFSFTRYENRLSSLAVSHRFLSLKMKKKGECVQPC